MPRPRFQRRRWINLHRAALVGALDAIPFRRQFRLVGADNDAMPGRSSRFANEISDLKLSHILPVPDTVLGPNGHGSILDCSRLDLIAQQSVSR